MYRVRYVIANIIYARTFLKDECFKVAIDDLRDNVRLNIHLDGPHKVPQLSFVAQEKYPGCVLQSSVENTVTINFAHSSAVSEKPYQLSACSVQIGLMLELINNRPSVVTVGPDFRLIRSSSGLAECHGQL